jgi:hypothetical protein
MSPQRLFVEELVSVGLVEAGDNDPATVLIWKKAPTSEPFDVRKTLESTAATIAKAEAHVAELERLDKARRERETMTPETARETIQELAAELNKKDPTLNPAKARTLVRKARPELAEAERSAGPLQVGKAENGELFGELVSQAIDRRARAWHAEGLHFDQSLAELRRQVRKAQPHLVQMERSRETVDMAKSRIEKTGGRDLLDALRFVKDWG